MRRMLIAALVVSVSGCSLTPHDTRAGYEAVEDKTPANANAPMAELPAAAGAVVAVLQTDAHDVLTQRIVLKGDPDTIGENAIVVKVNEGHGPWDIDGAIGMPTREMIASELDQDFAGVDMQLSNTFERNSFGPFGYAIGHPTPRVTCIYAWEFGVFKYSQLGAPPSGAPSMPVRPTSVRVRLCRSAIGEAEMLPMLRQLQVFAPGTRLAYVDPNYKGGDSGGDALAAAGIGYFVVPGATPAAPTRVAQAPAPARERPHRFAGRRRRHERAPEMEGRAAVDERPARDAVAVPMPGGANNGLTGAVDPVAPVNPLLAPLKAAPPAAADDMPLPSRLAPVERPTPAPPKAASIPLPN